MSDIEDDLTLSKPDFITVRGSMCKIFKAKNKPERLLHKSMGVINPVHIFEDPRKNRPNVKLEPRTKEMTLFDFSQKYKEKAFLPEHLTTPFIYIEKVVQKDVSGFRTFYQHPDQWNLSNNPHSTRIQTQIPKQELSELTRSIIKSKREKGDTNDYEQNERMKRFVRYFFKNLTQLLQEKRFNQDLAKEILNPNSKLWKEKSLKGQKDKQKDQKDVQSIQEIDSKIKKEDKKAVNKEFIELDKDYSLRELWKAFCIIKKLDFKHDEKQIVELSVFKDFIIALGYLEKKWNEIDKYYDYCNKKEDVGLVHPSEYDENIHKGAESPKREGNNAVDHADFGNSPLKTKSDFMKNSSLLQWKPARKKLQKSSFSMRAFLYNFDKYLRDIEKIPYVLSVRAATERKVGLKYYVNNFFKQYETTKNQMNQIRDLEEECYNIMKGIASEYNDPDYNREMQKLEDLENYLKNKPKDQKISAEEKQKIENEIVMQKERAQVEIDKLNELYRIAHDQFYELCNETDRVFYEKRVIMRFCLPVCKLQELLVMKSVEDAAADRIVAIRVEMEIISQFHDLFLQEKDVYQEKAFKLFELANYIHENNFIKSELDAISYFVKKVKSNYNVSRGQPKNAYLNPNQYISIDLFTKTFNIFKEKREHEIEIIDKLIEHFHDMVEKKMPSVNQERVKQKIEYNLMYDIFQRIFDDYDEQLEILFRKVTNVIEFILNDKSSLPPKYKNMLAYLIWGIYDRQDEYLPLEIRQKIEAPPSNSKTPVNKKLFGIGKFVDQNEKDEAIGEILGYNSGKNKSQDSEFDFENRQYLNQKFEQNGSLVQSDEELLSPFQNKKKKQARKSVEEDEEFAIEILNNKNNRLSKPGKLPFLNDNDISRISDNQENFVKFKQ
ncbi:hypothetical protein ABPG74_017899 [Tetrahymena malaccensis]